MVSRLRTTSFGPEAAEPPPQYPDQPRRDRNAALEEAKGGLRTTSFGVETPIAEEPTDVSDASAAEPTAAGAAAAGDAAHDRDAAQRAAAQAAFGSTRPASKSDWQTTAGSGPCAGAQSSYSQSLAGRAPSKSTAGEAPRDERELAQRLAAQQPAKRTSWFGSKPKQTI